MTIDRRLRDALEARAAEVPIAPDALMTIRGRVRRERSRRRGLLAAGSALGTAILAGGTAVALSLTSAVPDPTPQPTPPVVTTAAPTPSPSASPTPPPGEASNQPVYLAGVARGRPALYREYHRVESERDLPAAIAATVTNMIDGSPLDPSYATLWPAGAGVRGVTIAGTTVTVTLEVPSGAPAEPALAVQQLVYTVTAVTAQAGRQDLTQVKLDVPGASELWGVDITQPLRRAGHLDVLAPVWLDLPQEGAVVGRTFTVRVQGTVFEAAATLRIRSVNGGLVDELPVQLDAGPPARGVASFSLTLPPGQYVLEAFYYSAADGSVQGLDDHTITVR